MRPLIVIPLLPYAFLLVLLFNYLHLSSAHAQPNTTASVASTTVLSPGVHLVSCLSPSSSRCARVLQPSFLPPTSVSLLLSLAQSAFSLSPGGAGPVTILDLASGALSYQDRFVNALALMEKKGKFFPLPALALYVDLTQRVKEEITEKLNVTQPLYLTKPSFFARIDGDKEVVTVNDEYYHPHIDLEQYGSFDYTALIYLSQWNEDFTGGEFVFRDNKQHSTRSTHSKEAEVEIRANQEEPSLTSSKSATPLPSVVDNYTEFEVRPSPGSLLFFTSGGENVHYVRRVTSGSRSTLTIAFTKDEEQSVEGRLKEQYGEKIHQWRKMQQMQGENQQETAFN